MKHTSGMFHTAAPFPVRPVAFYTGKILWFSIYPKLRDIPSILRW